MSLRKKRKKFELKRGVKVGQKIKVLYQTYTVPDGTWPDGLPRLNRVGPIDTKDLEENAYALDLIAAWTFRTVKSWRNIKV